MTVTVRMVPGPAKKTRKNVAFGLGVVPSAVYDRPASVVR